MPADLATVFDQIAALDRAAAHTDATRKESGITYTPVWIVREMVRVASPQWNETIHEPSCGRGMFAFGLVEYWLNQGKSPEEIARWGGSQLFLCDTDERAIGDLKKLWADFFLALGVVADTANFIVTDGLFGTYSQRSFDLVIGNPPYVRIQHLTVEAREKIRERFASCAKGNVDLYYAFFEDALIRSRRACYIMPNSWFSNQSARTLRNMAHCKIQALVDFGSQLVFAPVRAYTAIVVIGPVDFSTPIRVRAGLSSVEQWQDIARDDPRFADSGWTPLLSRSTHQGKVLDDVAEIVSGIATLSDKSYLLPTTTLVEISGKEFVEQVDPDFPGHTLRVPVELAPRLIKATRTGGVGEQGPRILCPYDEQWKVIDEETLSKTAPDLLAWLGRRRPTLEGRDKGKTGKYEAWYAYGRRQGFWAPREDETVLLVPQMGNGTLTSVRVDLRHTRGRFLFTSGYVLRPKDPKDLESVEIHLGLGTTWDFVKREGKAWAGQGDYRTIGARALRKLPLNTWT